MRQLICVFALILLAGACGTADGTASSASASPQWLSSVVDDPRSEDGWVLPAGTWQTQAFSTPMVFDTDRDLTLVAEDDQIIYLRTPGANDLIMVARFTGMWNGSADVPVPAETAAMTKAWRANPANRVDDLGVVTADDGADTPWWDITISEKPEFTFPCALGTTCAFNSFAGNSKIFSLQGERMRSYARNDLEVGLGVHAAGVPEAIDGAVRAASAIAVSLRTAPDNSNPPPDEAFVGQHTGRHLPAGPHVVPMDNAAMLLDLPAESSDVDWFSTIGSLQLSSGESSLVISHPVLVDLDAPLGCPGSESAPPTSPSGFRPLEPVGEGELEEYLESQAEIADSGTAELLGVEVPWWEMGDPRPDRVNECGVNTTHLLIAHYEGGIATTADDPPMTLRIYQIDERLMVLAMGPDDDPISEFAPVLEHLSLM